MAWTSTDLAAIETAIASGTLTVVYRDRTVTYRSLDDMMRIRALIKEEVGSSTSFEDRGRGIRTGRGLDS